MSEKKEQLIDIPIKLLAIGICVWLYSYGGLEGTSKAWRRFVAPGVCVGTMFYFIRDWRVFIQLPFMFIPFGYGADTLWMKVWKRFYVGLWAALTTGGYYIYELTQRRISWLYVAFYSVFLVVGFILFGVWNPFESARIEESVLGLLQYGLPILIAKKRRKTKENKNGS